jgi:glucose-6-phosphate dehydrogenase assembly protein OpcA
MEETVTTTVAGRSSFEGREVPFGEIASAMVRGACRDAGAMRALVATVVAVGPTDRLDAAIEILQALGDAGTVRGILISEGDQAAPPARVAGNTVALKGLKAAYVNNAVAALRLSSLPTLVWWRGGRPETLGELTDLADRIVLAEDEPETIWRKAATLFEECAFSDLRWAKLTQWRALMAQFFDIPEVRSASRDFTRLHISGADRMSARLFAAWLTSSITFREGFVVDITDGDRNAPIQSIQLGDHNQELSLRMAGERNCLETAISVRGHRAATRIVSLIDHAPARVLTEELRIRARDLAFERAIQAVIAD